MKTVQEMWNASREEKVELLQRALDTQCPLDVELLGAEKEEMDELALPLGFVPVWVPTVDGSGLTNRVPGIVPSTLASNYFKRSVK